MSVEEIRLARSYAEQRASSSDVVVNMESVMDNLQNMYESAGYVKKNVFVNEAVLHHAGISIRVSDNADGEQYGMQTVIGSSFKKQEDVGILPYPYNTITHKFEYKESKCSFNPLRETHYFFNINTHIVYKHGKEEIFYNDTADVKDTVSQFNDLLQQLMETKEGISTWIRPVRSAQWGNTVDNCLKRRVPMTLVSYRDPTVPVDASRIRKRYKAIQILNGDNYAFRIAKKVETENSEQSKILENIDDWFDKNIYSFQYVTKTGVRQNYKEASVYSVMANTQVIIKHYCRLQVDLDSIRVTLNEILGPFYARNRKRRKNHRPWINRDKSVYIRYVMRDNILLNSFLEVYIAKAKEMAETGEDPDNEDMPDAIASQRQYMSDGSDEPYVDIHLEADDEEDDDDDGSDNAQVHIELEPHEDTTLDIEDDIQPYVQIELEPHIVPKKKISNKKGPTLAPEPRRSERLRQKPTRTYKK